MSARDLYGSKEMKFLKELARLDVDFIIVGLSSALLQGAEVEIGIIELWFDDPGEKRLKRALERVGSKLVEKGPDGLLEFAGEATSRFRVVDSVDGLLSYPKEKRRAPRISLGDFKVVALSVDQIITGFKTSGRVLTEEENKLVQYLD